MRYIEVIVEVLKAWHPADKSTLLVPVEVPVVMLVPRISEYDTTRSDARDARGPLEFAMSCARW